MMIFTLVLIYSHRAGLGGSKVYFCNSLIKFFSFLMSLSMAFRSIFKCSVEKPVATSVSKWLDFCKSWGQAFFSVDCPKLPLNFKNDFSLKILFYHVQSFFLSRTKKNIYQVKSVLTVFSDDITTFTTIAKVSNFTNIFKLRKINLFLL